MTYLFGIAVSPPAASGAWCPARRRPPVRPPASGVPPFDWPIRRR